MPVLLINGKRFNVSPLENDVYDEKDIRAVANIPEKRVMAVERFNGTKEIIKGKISLKPEDNIVDLPVYERG